MAKDRQKRSQGTGKESGQADNTHSPDNNKQSKRRAVENRSREANRINNRQAINTEKRSEMYTVAIQDFAMEKRQ